MDIIGSRSLEIAIPAAKLRLSSVLEIITDEDLFN